jgi:hypothetical protein
MIYHVSLNVPFLMVELRGQFNPQTDCCFSHVSPVYDECYMSRALVSLGSVSHIVAYHDST